PRIPSRAPGAKTPSPSRSTRYGEAGPSSFQSCGLPAGVSLDCAKHARVREAAAQHTGHALLNLSVGGFRVAIDERFRRHDHRVQAKSALCGLLVDERLLNRMR